MLYRDCIVASLLATRCCLISRRRLFSFFALVLTLSSASSALAADIVFPSIDVRGAAGAGQTVSHGSTAVFHNPACILGDSPEDLPPPPLFEPIIDVSAAHIVYTYEHTNKKKYKPATVKITTLPTTIGFGYQPIPDLAFGFAIQPTGVGSTQNIREVPIEIAGETGDYDITFGTSGSIYNYVFGAGASYKPHPSFTLGGGIIKIEESKILRIYSPEQVSPILDAAWGGSFQQFIGGVKIAPLGPTLHIGTSYRTAVIKKYQGSMKHLLSNDEYVVLDASGYTPSVFAFGFDTQVSFLKLFLDYQMEFNSKGRAYVKTGYPGCAEKTDLKDSHNVAGGVQYRLKDLHSFSLAVGNYPENVGDGYKPPESAANSGFQSTPEALDGVTIGTPEALPRRIFAGSYRYNFPPQPQTGYVQTAFHYAYGSRTVPRGYPNEGDYSIKIFVGSLAVTLRF